MMIFGANTPAVFIFLAVLFLVIFNLEKIFPKKEFTDFDRIKLAAKMNGCSVRDFFAHAYTQNQTSFRNISLNNQEVILKLEEQFLQEKSQFCYENIPWLKKYVDENFLSWEEQKKIEKNRNTK